MSTLKIALLGPPEVDHLGHRLILPDRKALALLAYLATEGGMHERQKLTRLLWPESDMAHGRTALRITLLHLRHILEEDALPERASHLLITHDALGLDLASSIDLETAWKLVRVLPAPEAVQGEVRRTLIAQLDRAATLYRGSFLQDFTLRETLDFDNWVGMQQGYWYQRIEQVFDWLSQLQRAEGAPEQAIETVERWRSFDPLNEDISLRLMQLQFATGNRVAALKTYETYQDVLMTELSAKPSRILVALAEVLRNASPPRGAPSGVGRCTSAVQLLLDIPFVGRGAEFSRLMTLYEQASNGHPHELKTGILSEDGPGYSCFLVLVVPPVQRRTSDAWASIILCVSLVACARYSDSHLVCQHFIESLSFHSPQDGMGLPPLAWSRKEAFAIQPERCA